MNNFGNPMDPAKSAMGHENTRPQQLANVLPSFAVGEHDATAEFNFDDFVYLAAAAPTFVADDAMGSVEEDGDLPVNQEDTSASDMDSDQSSQEADADGESIGEDEQGIASDMMGEDTQLKFNSGATRNEIPTVATEPEPVTSADQLDVQILSVKYDIEAEYTNLLGSMNQAQEAAAIKEKALAQWEEDRKAAGRGGRKTKKEQAELTQIKDEADKAVALSNQLQDAVNSWTSYGENDSTKQAFITQLRARHACDHAKTSEANFKRSQAQRDTEQAAANKEIADLDLVIRTEKIQRPNTQAALFQPYRAGQATEAEQIALFEASRVRMQQLQRYNATVGLRNRLTRESLEREAAGSAERAAWEASLQEAQKALKEAKDACEIFEEAQRVQGALEAAEEARRAEEMKRAAAEEAKVIAALEQENRVAEATKAVRHQGMMTNSLQMQDPFQFQHRDFDLAAINQSTGFTPSGDMQLPTSVCHPQYSQGPTINHSLSVGSSISPRSTQSASPTGPSRKTPAKRKASADGGPLTPTPKKTKQLPTNARSAPANVAAPIMQATQSTVQTQVFSTGCAQWQDFDPQCMSQTQLLEGYQIDQQSASNAEKLDFTTLLEGLPEGGLEWGLEGHDDLTMDSKTIQKFAPPPGYQPPQQMDEQTPARPIAVENPLHGAIHDGMMTVI